MPRISREAAAAKESFVLSLLTDNPALTPKEIQEAVKAKFGGAMNADRVKALRASLTGSPPPSTETPSTETIAEPAALAPAALAPPAPEPQPPVELASTPAPTPTAPTEPPVITVVEQVTDQNGTYIRPVQSDTRPTRQIAPGLTEVIQ